MANLVVQIEGSLISFGKFFLKYFLRSFYSVDLIDDEIEHRLVGL